jgi:hypothetical protein
MNVKRGLSRLAMTCAIPALLTAPAAADPTVGLGLSFSFGGGTVDTGIGVRVFSDNEADSTVGSLGLDYMFQSRSWRGTAGVAYLGTDGYIGLDVGLGLDGGGFDFGLGAGVADTEPAMAPPAPPPPSPLPPTPYAP